MDRYAAPSVVEWHFAGVHNRWTRRALAFAGFGFPSADKPDALGNWCPVYTVASSYAGATLDVKRKIENLDDEAQSRDEERRRHLDVQVIHGEGRRLSREDCRPDIMALQREKNMEPVYGIDRPFFHHDLSDAVDVAVRDAKKRSEKEKTEQAVEEVSYGGAFTESRPGPCAQHRPSEYEPVLVSP